jgi:outer membrane biosynthesis protein TonB
MPDPQKIRHDLADTPNWPINYRQFTRSAHTKWDTIQTFWQPSLVLESRLKKIFPSGTEQYRPAPAPEHVEPSVTQRPRMATPTAANSEITVGKPESVAEPVPVAAEPEPEPAAATPEPEPAPEAVTPAPAPTPTATTPTPKPVAAAPEPKPEPEPEPAPAKFAARSLPVPDYDAATLASVRASLRALSAVQVSVLREYEAANAARADFLRMFDNRIAKLTGHN